MICMNVSYNNKIALQNIYIIVLFIILCHLE